jgi:50S ribosomal protein L16 3-hydroxylase
MPDELAGLSCHENVESRIVLEKDRLAPWSVLHGPFYESDFKTLPDTHWTLLVQECNIHVPELALLLDRFNFIPNWRVDDIMVSYAVKEGSVGPHIDQYDVFLLQASGLRRWQINTRIDKNAEFLQDTELRILKNFDSEQEWILEPGDMLYLPPGVAHYGVALNDCMTISVGFRAPDYYSLMAAYIDDQYASISDVFSIPRYQDPDLAPQQSSGEISEKSLQKIVEIIQSSSKDDQTIKQWFGRYITEAKNAIEPELPETDYTPETLREACNFETEIYRLEDARFAYIKKNESVIILFVNGEEFGLYNDATILAPIICDHRRVLVSDIQELLIVPGICEILVSLFNKGYLYFNET